ncbi:hypothetical protein J6590_020614 [Homalodisca vitripennis]|nr:hypothetical protein J6590_020614 [Homalodisca vitripennis]
MWLHLYHTPSGPPRLSLMGIMEDPTVKIYDEDENVSHDPGEDATVKRSQSDFTFEGAHGGVKEEVTRLHTGLGHHHGHKHDDEPSPSPTSQTGTAVRTAAGTGDKNTGSDYRSV